ncbi:hypothetical protein, partial [Enterococcus faecium]|uniref:hypothetical protein n=1 Tax=Enterococcus faecium TaxID=1352 RepID=UPI003DA1699B
MALELSFTISEKSTAKSLVFVDTTGTYNNPDNLTGWGDPPNVDLADVHVGELECTSPSGVVTIIDVFATGDFP